MSAPTITCPFCGEQHAVTGLRMKCTGRRRRGEAGVPLAAATLDNLTRSARRLRWELHFLRDITATVDEPPVREFRFHPTRQWRFDFAWPALRVAVEVEGLTPIRVGTDESGESRVHVGRHQSIDGMNDDLEKYAEAAVLGWRVLRVSQAHVKSGEACTWTKRLIELARSAPTLTAPSRT